MHWLINWLIINLATNNNKVIECDIKKIELPLSLRVAGTMQSVCSACMHAVGTGSVEQPSEPWHIFM